MIQNLSMLIFNSECIISFRFENLFWCLDETLINRQLLQLQFLGL